MPYILMDARQVHPYGYTYVYTSMGALTGVMSMFHQCSDRTMPYILMDARQVHPYGYTYGYTSKGALTGVSPILLHPHRNRQKQYMALAYHSIGEHGPGHAHVKFCLCSC